MLKDLNVIPLGSEHRKKMLLGSTGMVLHEVGHIVGSALVGIPTDYVIVDQAPEAKRHGIYIHAKYRNILARDVAVQIRIAAAGFAAEELIFGRALLDRSEDDLRCIASLLKIRFDRAAMPFIARSAQSMCGPIIPVGAIDMVCSTYARVAAAIDSGRHEVDGAHIVPFHAFWDSELPIPPLRQLMAAARTLVGRGRTDIIATLRSEVRSGL